MKKLEPQELQYNIGLVKWQNQQTDQQFNLLTVHSLIVDDHPKFQQLKSIVRQFNNKQPKSIARPNLRFAYISKLYRMLCELIRIPKMENQIAFLNKVYQWAHSGKIEGGQQFNESKQSKDVRPTTASTRTRPFSAYSRPFSGNMKDRAKLNQLEFVEMNTDNKKVDYEKLRLGEKQFYEGKRTMHPELEHPKKRLKQFHRKVFYDENEKQDDQLVQPQEPLKEIPLVQVKRYKQPSLRQPLKQQQVLNPIQPPSNLQEPQNNLADNLQGGQNDAFGEEDLANVDDLPLDVEDEGGIGDEEQQPEDKLRPAVKVYTDKPKSNFNKKQYFEGENKYLVQRGNFTRTNVEDTAVIQMMGQYANYRGVAKSQMKRRSQATRMVTQKLGVPTYVQYQQQIRAKTINDLTLIPIPTTKAGHVRPRTAFTSQTNQNLKGKIGQAIMTGKLSTHITKQAYPPVINQKYKSLTSYAPKTTKKTFEEILFEAEERVHRESIEQTQKIKEILAKKKVASSAQTISKTIGYEQIDLPGDDIIFGQIVGTGMLKNPFFKVAKKKKKKKKKK